SPSFSFSVVAPPAPTPITPAGTINSTTPTFSWSAVTGAALYDLWVDGLSPFQSQIIRQQNIAINSFTQGAALAKGSYRFWVRAINANGNAGNWSGEVDFTIV